MTDYVAGVINVPAQKTVFCTLDSTDETRYVELLTLDGVTLNLDSPGGLGATSTNLLIDGVSYLPYGCSVEIGRDSGVVSVVTTVLVTPKGA